jgi:hypothetical protein
MALPHTAQTTGAGFVNQIASSQQQPASPQLNREKSSMT